MGSDWFVLFRGCKRCDTIGLTGGGIGGLAHEGMDDKFFEWWEERKSMMQERGMFIFILLKPVVA